MERITIYDKDNYPLDPSEITLGQIFDYEIVIINGSIFRNNDLLADLGNGDVMTLLGVSSIENYNEKTIFELRNDFSESIDYAKENGDIVILLEEGIDTKFPFIYANGLLDKKSFWNTVKVLNELSELNQECEDTFKIKDGNVTDIDITGIALMSRFRDKD